MDIGDGFFYLACYGVIPITITAFSLIASTNELVSLTYLYITIFVSALGCIYDMTSRYKQTQETFLRGKLVILSIPSFVIGLYCIIVAFGIMITSSIQYRCDKIMLCYIVSVVICLADLVITIIKNTMIKKQVESH